MSFLQKNSDYFLLNVKAAPNSAKNKINGVFIDEKNQEYLKVSIATITDDGNTIVHESHGLHLENFYPKPLLL